METNSHEVPPPPMPARPTRVVRVSIVAATVVGLAILLWVVNRENDQEVSKYHERFQRPTAAWKESLPPEGEFQVLMPGDPKKETVAREVEGVTRLFTYYIAHDALYSFSVGFVDYPESEWAPWSTQRILDRFPKAIGDRAGYKIVADRADESYGLPGRELFLEEPKNNRRMQMRILVAGRRCYLLQCIGPTGHEDTFTDMAKKFFSSFKLTSPASGPG